MNERIVIEAKICHGKPVIRGTRMPVALVVGSLAGGMSFEEVQRDYDLSIEDVLEETERRVESGETTFSDWEKTKISIVIGSNED
jgi:uncharacterized protein (DUF433 family)